MLSAKQGPSGTSYEVYKNCPKLLLHLWRILQVFWRTGMIPEQWRVAERVWISHLRHCHPNHHREASQQLGQGFFYSSLRDTTSIQSTCNEWPPWKVQSLGVPSRHSSQNPVTPPCLQSPHLNSGDL